MLIVPGSIVEWFSPNKIQSNRHWQGIHIFKCLLPHSFQLRKLQICISPVTDQCLPLLAKLLVQWILWLELILCSIFALCHWVSSIDERRIANWSMHAFMFLIAICLSIVPSGSIHWRFSKFFVFPLCVKIIIADIGRDRELISHDNYQANRLLFTIHS